MNSSKEISSPMDRSSNTEVSLKIAQAKMRLQRSKIK